MTHSKVDASAGHPLAYKPRDLVALTPWSYQTILEFIHAGELPAKRRRDKDGQPVGPFLVMHDDLVAFLDAIPEA
jgi:hypothetical protein